MTKLDLLILSVSLLAANRLQRFCCSLLTIVSRSFRFFSAYKMLVLSVKR